MEGDIQVTLRFRDGSTRRPWARRWDGTRFASQGVEINDGIVISDWDSRYEFRVESLRGDIVGMLDESGASCTVIGTSQHPRYPRRKVFMYVTRQGGLPGLRLGKP